MLRVPVISAIGHERDSTLIDDVAAFACSTPTHAPEAVIPLDCGAARRDLERCVGALRRAASAPSEPRGAIWAPSPAARPGRCAVSGCALNQKTREIRASSERGLAAAARAAARRSRSCWSAPRAAPPGPTPSSAAEALRRAAVALRAHDPERTLERGYALAEDPRASR